MGLNGSMKIVNQPQVTPMIEGGRKYKLMNEVTYLIGNEKIVIYPGYVFDGASVPRFLHWFIGPMDPRVVASSLIHDAIYTNPDLKGVGQYFVDDKPTEKKFTKEEADILFKKSNKANNMDSVRTNLAYWAVKLFGRGSF